MEHELKIYPWFFCALVTGKKRFELRENDRNYQVGDTLILREYDPAQRRYTGYVVRAEVTYLLNLNEYLELDTDYVVLSITTKV